MSQTCIHKLATGCIR